MSTIFTISNIIIYIFIVGVMGILPYIVRHDVFFGISAPTDFYTSDTAKKMRKHYLMTMILLSILFAVLAYFLKDYFAQDLLPFYMAGVLFLLIVMMTVVYLIFRNKAKKLKVTLNWDARVHPVAVADTTFHSSKIAVSKWWFVVYIFIIAMTIAVGFIFYDSMPQNVPMQTAADGTISYAQKSVQLIFYMPAVQLFLSLAFGLGYYSIRKARPELNPQQAKKTATQNMQHRYAWSCFLVFSGILLLAVFLITQLEMVGIVRQGITVIISLASVGAMIIAVSALAVKTGQSGSRLKSDNKDTTSDVIHRDDDKHWKFGLFYVNRADPSLFVEKRFGVGFTLNFGKPLGWMVMGVIVIIIIGAIIIN